MSAVKTCLKPKLTDLHEIYNHYNFCYHVSLSLVYLLVSYYTAFRPESGFYSLSFIFIFTVFLEKMSTVCNDSELVVNK
jgi:hypothetical protein